MVAHTWPSPNAISPPSAGNAGLDIRDQLSSFRVDARNRAVALIQRPHRSRAGGQEARLRSDFDRCTPDWSWDRRRSAVRSGVVTQAASSPISNAADFGGTATSRDHRFVLPDRCARAHPSRRSPSRCCRRSRRFRLRSAAGDAAWSRPPRWSACRPANRFRRLSVAAVGNPDAAEARGEARARPAADGDRRQSRCWSWCPCRCTVFLGAFETQTASSVVTCQSGVPSF